MPVLRNGAMDVFGRELPCTFRLSSKPAKLGPIGSVSVFDGKEADYLECYRVLQGAEIWQSLGPWITHHKPRFADDIAQRFAGTAAITPDDIARYAPIRVAIRDRIRATRSAGHRHRHADHAVSGVDRERAG